MKEPAHAIVRERAGTAVVLLVGVRVGLTARRVRRERREPPQQAPHARDSRLALERDGQVRGARSAHVGVEEGRDVGKSL